MRRTDEPFTRAAGSKRVAHLLVCLLIRAMRRERCSVCCRAIVVLMAHGTPRITECLARFGYEHPFVARGTYGMTG
jgi:hypothetical protein